MIAALHDAVHAWIAANSATLREHLLVSTALLLVLLAVAALPLFRSRTRFALILLGVTKFLIPAAVLTVPATRLAPEPVASSRFSIDVALFADPSPASEIYCVLAAIWLAGAALVALRMTVTYLHWHRTIRRATAASDREQQMMADVARQSALRHAPRVVRSSAGGPMTAGLLRCVVLIPSCADHFDDDELKAVLAHEVAHVERRHNLAAFVQNVATTLFWFNPALWLANTRLHLEAEKDCDERVLEFVPDPPAYLSGILKASHGFIAPQPAGVSCMSTTRLKERMDNLMRQQNAESRSAPHWLAVVVAVGAVLITTAFLSTAAPASAPAPPTYATDTKDNVTEPKLVSRVLPVYPESARIKRAQGMVIVETTINAKGDVTGVAVAKRPAGDEGESLAEAALAAVKQWKFEPAKKAGKPVEVKYNVTVNFKLDCHEQK